MTAFLRQLVIASSLLSFAAVPVSAEIPDIDSSGWATDPRDHGMSPREYIQAESRAFFADFIGRSGINTFFHFPGLASAEDRFVVSPNNDTVYSAAIVNVSEGFTLELPEVGDRFISIQITDENHVTPFYIYGGGSRSFEAEQFESKYVVVGIRTGTNATADDLKEITQVLQPKFDISGAVDVDDMARPELEILARVRKVLLAEYSKLATTSGAMQPRTELIKNWEFFTYVTAGAWGLSSDDAAMYKPYALDAAKGGVCYTATYPQAPAKEFYSITVYGPDLYLMSNKDNIVSSNRGVNLNADGSSFTVAFGGENCRSLAPNFIYTPKDGWSMLLRAYRPDVDAFKAYQMPEITAVE